MARVILVGDPDGFRQLAVSRVSKIEWSFANLPIKDAVEFVKTNKVAHVAFAESVSTEDREKVKAALGEKAITVVFTVIDPLNVTQVEALLAELKGE